MLKIPSKLSISLSITLSVAFFVVCIGGAVIMPSLADILIEARGAIGNTLNPIPTQSYCIILLLAYMALGVATLADMLLLALLLRVRKGLVFTPSSVSLIRGVSWCCFFISAVFCGLGIYFHLAFVLAFVAIFLGLCLRIVKNVIEEATEIKSENDLTV